MLCLRSLRETIGKPAGALTLLPVVVVENYSSALHLGLRHCRPAAAVAIKPDAITLDRRRLTVGLGGRHPTSLVDERMESYLGRRLVIV